MRLLKLCLVFCIFLWALNPSYGYADEEEGNTPSTPETTESKSNTLVDTASARDANGNILTLIGADATKRGRLEEALKYNEQIHYIMTYSILANEYLATTGYADLYKTGAATTGYDENIQGLTVKTGYDAVLKGDLAAETPHDEQEVREAESAGAITEEAYKSSTEEFAKKVTNKLIRLYAQKYVTEDKNLEDNSGVLGGIVEIWGEWGIEKTQVYAKVSKVSKESLDFPKMADIESRITQIKNEDPANTIYAALYKEVLEALYAGNYLKLFDAKIANSQLAHTYMSRVNYTYEGFTKVTALSTVSHGVIFSKAEGTEDVATMKKNVSIYPARGLIARLHADDVDAKYKEYLNDVGTLDKYKDELKADYEKWEKIAKQHKEAEKQGAQAVQAEGVATLGWIPLDYRAQLTGEKFKSLTAMFDGGVINDTDGRATILGNTGGSRAIQANDIFAFKKDSSNARKPTASPYLTYDYEGNKNYSVGTAYVGKSSYSLNADLGLYAGMKTENTGLGDLLWGTITGVFGKSEYGLATPLTSAEIINNSKQLYPHKYISYLATKEDAMTTLKGGTDYTIGIDNYGNIISGSTLQVIVPYWHNTALPFFSGFNSSSSFFAATPVYKGEVKSDVLQVAKAGAQGGKFKENSNLNIETFTINPNNYSQFLSSVSAMGGSGLETFVSSASTSNANIQALALSIVTETKSAVGDWNAKFNQIAKEQGEVYISTSNGGRGQDAAGEDLLEKFNAADLLERIKMILDYGFYEIIRLTIVSWVVSFYTGTISNFTLSEIFHTKLITQTEAWAEMIIPIAMLLGAFVGVYMVFLGFRVARNTLPLKSFFVQLVALTSALVIPMALYAPIVDLALNKPTQWVLGPQMEQVGILDNYLYVEGKDRAEIDETYKLLFGSEADLRDRSQDYLVTFYTTTHKDGFNIDTVTIDDLTKKNKARTLDSLETGQWQKSDLVSVKVSVYDLFDWVMDETAAGMTLFEWLAGNKSERYTNITEYTEFSVIPEMTRGLDNAPIKSSEVYRMLYDHSETVSDSVLGLYSVAQAFRNSEKTSEEDAITDDDRDAFIRDLAFPSEVRTQVFGNATSVSPSTTALWAKYGGGATLPSTDFFNLEATVQQLVPTRDVFSTRLNGDIYNINREVLDNYIVNYSVVRESIGSPSAFKRAEFHAIVLDMWFAVNDVLDIHLAPTRFAIDTVSMDNYMRLVFIPMREYADLNNKGLDNVGQYIALRTHPGTLLLVFLPMLILMMIFGFLYLFTFYFLMMLLIVISFIWNYVIKNNMRNKSWLGALVIIVSFALAKLGLMVLWRIMSFILNYAITSAGDTYPYVLIHSIVISVYLAVVIYLLFTKVFKSVLQDKGNLGGEIFADSISKFASSITGALTGDVKVLGKGFKGAGATAKSMGNSVRNTLKNEGTEGQVKPKANAFSANKLDRLAGVYDRQRIDEDLADINYAIHDDGNVGSGHEFGLRFANVNDSLHQEAAYSLGEKYDSIEKGYVGLSKEQIEHLEERKAIGQVISSSEDGHNITTIDAVTTHHTEHLKAALEKAGVDVYQDGTELSFNSTDINLMDAGVRKAIFGDILPNLLDETHKVSQLSEHTVTNTDDITGLGVYHQMQDGRIAFKVGEDGLAPQTLSTLLQSNEFKQNFIADETPMMKDGKYLQGYLIAMPRGKDSYVQAGHISNVVDTELRKNTQDVGARTQQELSIIDIQESEKATVYEHLVEGMKLQQFDDGKYGIVYEAEDKEQEKAANVLRSVIYRTRDAKQEENIDVMQRTMAYINEGGSNGYYTETVNTNTNRTVLQEAYAKGLASRETVTSVYAGERSEEFIESLTQMQRVMQADPEKMQKYAVAQDYLYRQGEELLLGKDQNYEKAINVMFKYADKQKIEDVELAAVKSKFTQLKQSFATMDITEQQYARQAETLMAEAQIRMQQTGVYDVFAAEQLREAIKKEKKPEMKIQLETILNNYISGKQGLKEAGIDTKVFTSYSSEEFDKVMNHLENVKGVERNPDGTVQLKSINPIAKEQAEEMAKILLGTNAEKEKEK